MKKFTLILGAILAFASIACVCACGGDKEQENSSKPTSSEQDFGGGIELPEDKFD